jgi:hypothetical protein
MFIILLQKVLSLEALKHDLVCEEERFECIGIKWGKPCFPDIVGFRA